MNIYLTYPDEASPCYPWKAGAEARPISGPSKKQDAGRGSHRRGKPNVIAAHPKPSWVMRACSTLWAALAIAMSLFAVPLRAQFAYVANFNSNNVSGYTIDPSTGALTAIAGSPFAAGSFSRSVAVDPNGKFAYVANDDGTVSGYTIDPSTGALTGIAGSPFTTGGDLRSMAVDPSGKFAYVADFLGNVLGYTIDPSTGALSTIAGSPFAASVGVNSVTVSPSSKFVYAVNLEDNNVLGYTIDPSTGALTAIAGSPFAAGIGATSVAVDPSGKFAYVVNAQVIGQNGNVSAYTIDPSTGALSPIAGSPFAAGNGPQSVAVDPSGKFAYVTNSIDNNVSGYTIGPTSGALTPIAGSPFAAGNGPNIGAVDPSGKFAYVANFNSNNVSGYTIDPSTGALTAIAGSPFAAGGEPFSVAIITPPPLVPFASSFAKLEIKAGPPPDFDLNESFTLGKNSKGIKPVTENVTLQIGTSSVTILPGLFKKNPNGRFAFQGVINGVNLQVQIVPLGNNIFTFMAEGTGLNLTGLSNPVTVVLTIGIDSGTTAVNAQFNK